MSSTYLRLAAPLQSWATARVTGNIVRTEQEPTTDGLRGLVAASLGAQRGKWPAWINDLKFTVRMDRRGELIDEFQTINPREEDLRFQRRLFALTTGRRWSKSTHFTPDGQHLTSVVRRTYLADAEFLVEVRSSDHGDEVALALRYPRFTPYLGRKAFAPTFPYYLGIGEPGLLDQLPSIARDTGVPIPPRAATLCVRDHRRCRVVVPLLEYEDWLDAVRASCKLPAG